MIINRSRLAKDLRFAGWTTQTVRVTGPVRRSNSSAVLKLQDPTGGRDFPDVIGNLKATVDMLGLRIDRVEPDCDGLVFLHVS